MLGIGSYKPWVLTLLCTALVSCTALSKPLVEKQPGEQARSADAFVDTIGVNVHLTYIDTAYGNWDGIIKPRLRESGIRHIRDGGFSHPEYFKRLKELGKLGIKSNLIFFGLPTKEVVSIVGSLKGTIESVEGTNESDLPHFKFSYNGQKFPEGTRAYQKELYITVKATPETKYLPVIMPSMGHGENALQLGYLEWGDMGNMHSYPNLGERPTYDIDWYFIRHARTMVGNTKPLMATETGYHNLICRDATCRVSTGISETAASKYIPRLLFEYFNRNIKRTYLYEFIDEHPDPKNLNKENHYGLLRNNGSPKPAYTVIKNLISLLKERSAKFTPGRLDYKLSGNTTNVHHTLMQKSNGNFYLILWQDAKSWDNKNMKNIPVADRKVTVTLNTIIRQASIYQPLKAVTPIRQFTSSSGIKQLPLNVPDHPLAIELVPASRK